MTCRNLLRARAHADLCERVEACAPPVTAPYLQQAYDRMKLGVRGWYEHEPLPKPFQVYVNIFHFSAPLRHWIAVNERAADDAYRLLCAQLESAAPDRSTVPAATLGAVIPPDGAERPPSGAGA